jgi:probable HAF family extracellular repeat protein
VNGGDPDSYSALVPAFFKLRWFMTRNNRFSAWVLTLLLLVPLASAQKYNIIDLGTFPGGNVSQGQAISKCGHVAGWARFPSFNSDGFFWSGHGLHVLDALPPQGNVSFAEAINSSGDVAGYSTYDYPPYPNSHAVVWIQGKIHDLGTLPGSDDAQAMGMNDAGEVVGFSVPDAFLWTEQQGMQDLGTLPGGSNSQAFGINKRNEVVGSSDVADGNTYGFVWTKSTGMHALPALPDGYSSSANGINDQGQIVGGSSAGYDNNYAVLWTYDGKVVDLGVLPGQVWSSAFAINNLGQVVGWSGYRAFIWSESEGMQDLNDLIPSNSGWVLGSANGINDHGQITGQGNINGESHGFVLTPTSEAPWACS